MNHNWSATKQHLHLQNVAEISRYSVLSGDKSRMWDIVWVSPQGHRSVSVSRHFLLQAPQCPCSVQSERFSRDRCCRGRSKPGCQIVGSHTRWELTTWANFQLCLHRLLQNYKTTTYSIEPRAQNHVFVTHPQNTRVFDTLMAASRLQPVHVQQINPLNIPKYHIMHAKSDNRSQQNQLPTRNIKNAVTSLHHHNLLDKN